jgi:large subunit ribosomal protein L15
MLEMAEEYHSAMVEAAAEADDDDDDDDDKDDDGDDDKDDDEEVTDDATGLKIVVHYRRSFMARLIQSQDKVQDYYTGLKNVLLSFEGVKSRVSWNYDSFNRGRKQLAKINIRGKSLMLYLALDPKEFEDTKYFFTDVSDKLKFSKVPMRIKVRSGRGFKHGVELIEEMMNRLGIERQEIYHPQDFHMPYETTQQLVDRGLIKVINPEEEEKIDANFVMENLSDFIRDEVSVAEADALFTDDIAKLAMKHVVRERTGNKKTFINLDTICEHFEDGATVNLAALKEKKLVPKNIGRLKVLADGELSRPITVKAESYSVQAIKMIELTGGTVVILKD